MRAMKVILARHGNYAGGSADPGLSAEGWVQARALGAFLAARGVCPQVVVTSGYRRAEETARAVCEALPGAPEWVVSRDFVPSGEPAGMAATLEGLGAASVLAVGHMCAIGELARALCPAAPLVFGTCDAVALEGAGADWELLWVRKGALA